MSRGEPKAPLPGRLVGYAVVLLVCAATARLLWEIVTPVLPSLVGVLVTLVVARYCLRRFL